MKKKTLIITILAVAVVIAFLTLDPVTASITAMPLLFGMAVTTEKSTQETNRTATPPVKAQSNEFNAPPKYAYFSFTQGAVAGDANSLANLITLPPGEIRLLKTESKFVCSAFGSARTLDIGYLAHTKRDGTAVNASIDAVLDGGDVSAAAGLTCGAGTNALGTDPCLLLDSKSGVTIQAKCLGDTLPAGATLKGYFAYLD